MHKILFLGLLLLTFVLTIEAAQTNETQKTNSTKITKPVVETPKQTTNTSKVNSSNTDKSSTTDKSPSKNPFIQHFSKISSSVASKFGSNIKSYWYHAPSKSLVFFKSSNPQEDDKNTTSKTPVKSTKNAS